MAFDYDEVNPTGPSFISDFTANERAQRLSVKSSIEVDHFAEEGPTTPAQDGFHRQVSLPPLAGDPSTVNDAGFLYAKVISGFTELFYLDDTGQVIQLTEDGSASPDKLPIAGGTMTGSLIMDGAGITVEGGLIRLDNALELQGQNVAASAYHNLIRVDSSDVCEVGDNSFGGGLRLAVDTEDAGVISWGAGDKKIWHEGHFANPPVATNAYESTPASIALDTPGAITHSIAGGTPGLWMAYLVCTSGDNGFSVDDEIPIVNGQNNATQRGITVFANATQFKWNSAQTNPIQFVENDGTTSNIDYSKWKIVFRAWY